MGCCSKNNREYERYLNQQDKDSVPIPQGNSQYATIPTLVFSKCFILRAEKKAILKTIQDPEEVYTPIGHFSDQFLALNSNMRIHEELPSDNLVVHYKEVSQDDGFIITAHLISNERKRRMIKKWKKV